MVICCELDILPSSVMIYSKIIHEDYCKEIGLFAINLAIKQSYADQ